MEVVGQAVEFAEVGDQHRLAERAQNVDAVEEVAMVDRLALPEVPQGHLGDDQDIFILVGRLLQELGRAQLSMSTTTLVTGRKLPRKTRIGRL